MEDESSGQVCAHGRIVADSSRFGFRAVLERRRMGDAARHGIHTYFHRSRVRGHPRCAIAEGSYTLHFLLATAVAVARCGLPGCNYRLSSKLHERKVVAGEYPNRSSRTGKKAGNRHRGATKTRTALH